MPNPAIYLSGFPAATPTQPYHRRDEDPQAVYYAGAQIARVEATSPREAEALAAALVCLLNGGA